MQSRPVTTLSVLKQDNDQKEEALLNQIKNVDWKYLVNRREALLFRSFTTHCYEYFYETTKIDWKPTAEFRPGADLLYSEKELELLAQKFTKGEAPLLNSFYKRLIKYVSQLDNVAHEISKINFAKMKNKELGDVLEKYIEAGQRAHTFLLPMPLADPVISRHILSLLPDNVTEKKRQYWLSALTYPSKENEHTKEERAFYQLLEAYKAKSKNFTALLDKHLANFSWIGARWYFWHNVWNENDVIQRLEEFVSQGKNPKQELKHLNQIQADREREMHKVFKEINLSEKDLSKLKDFVELAKKYAYARTWRTDVVYRAGYLARHLFEEIVSRAGFGKTDAQYMTFFELRDLVCGKKTVLTKDEIKKRREFYGSVLLGNKYDVFSGLEWKEKLKNLYSPDVPNNASEIKGTIVYHGKVKGIAKVIHQTEEMGKINRGDILIAVMTFPNLVPAMEKAAAFVTDEGGILCHAAIVSREMNKPCIIGTKIATQVLRDGDLVEVDAERGIVKILKKANTKRK